MCSNVSQPGISQPRVSQPRRPTLAEAELATMLAAAIDELAAAADQDAASSDVAARLAWAWAMITAADPELAARTARYSHS
jgi:hypothetical protein